VKRIQCGHEEELGGYVGAEISRRDAVNALTAMERDGVVSCDGQVWVLTDDNWDAVNLFDYVLREKGTVIA